MRRLAREPLVHFLVLGALIFGAYTWLQSGREKPDESSRIVIDQAELDYLSNLWKVQWKRDPAPDDVKAIIDRYVRQEVFYREALKMKLDHNDEIVKRRMAQKMEAVASDLGTLMRPPTDVQLKTFLADNKALFTLPQAFAFKQVLYLPDEERAGAPIKATLASLRDGGAIPADRVNKLALRLEWPLASAGDIDNAFGGDFSRALGELPIGQWSGPIRSGYGLHLVYLEQKQDPVVPEFDQIRDFVSKEYEYRNVLAAQDQLYEELLDKYDVEITAADVSPETKAEFAGK